MPIAEGQSSFRDWFLSARFFQQLLLILAIAWVCFVIYLVGRIQRVGLLGLLPGWVAAKCRRPPFETVNEVLDRAIVFGSNLLRVAMLASMDLTEEQRLASLEGFTSDFYRDLFNRPLLEQVPPPILKLLVGRGEQGSPQKAQHATLGLQLATPRCVSIDGDFTKTRRKAANELVLSCRSHSPRPSAQDSLRELGNLVRDIRDDNKGRIASLGLQQIFNEKMAENMAENSLLFMKHSAFYHHKAAAAAFGNARWLASNATAQASKAIVSPRFRTTAVAAAGGAAALGTGGGATGFVLGGCVGTTVGLLPAVFTFGLSIPVGAMFGAFTGMFVGAGVGSSAGLVGGGAAGYCLHSHFDTASAACRGELENGRVEKNPCDSISGPN
jgi:hypothetical protein